MEKIREFHYSHGTSILMQRGKQKTTRTNKFNDPSGGKFYENIKKGGFEG